MLHIVGMGLCLAAVAARGAGAGPYRGIVDRNVFALKPPATNVVDTTPPPPPLKITLTGITTMLGNKRALMAVAVPNKQPETYMLTEGQRQGEIEVLEIDEKAGVVKVKNHGIPQSLDFKTDGAKPNPAPAVASTTPGVIPQPIPPPMPQANAAPGGNPQPQIPVRTIPTRSMRIPAPPGGTPPAPAE